MTAQIGIKSGNAIVPYVSTTKRTKIINVTDAAHITLTAASITGSSIIGAYIQAYSDSTGKWRFRFNITLARTAGSTRTSAVCTFVAPYAVTFNNTGSFVQVITGMTSAGSTMTGYTATGAPTITLLHADADITQYHFSGDVELESEPTWVAANMEGAIAADVYIAPASGATPGIVDNLAQHFHGVKDFGDGIKLNTGDTLSTYAVNTWTPIVTLVGGSGNTVPVYTTNLGRYTRIGNRVFCEIILSGDGGDEGAGTGTVAISLPFGAVSSGLNYWGLGYVYNSTTELQPLPVISAGASIVTINYWNAGSLIALTGAGQNNASRGMQISIVYEAV